MDLFLEKFCLFEAVIIGRHENGSN